MLKSNGKYWSQPINFIKFLLNLLEWDWLIIMKSSSAQFYATPSAYCTVCLESSLLWLSIYLPFNLFYLPLPPFPSSNHHMLSVSMSFCCFVCLFCLAPHLFHLAPENCQSVFCISMSLVPFCEPIFKTQLLFNWIFII